MVLGCLGCSDEHAWFGFENPFKHAISRSRPATLETCEFRGGQLRINGTCGNEGEILLILPTTKGDNRIIGSPRCSNGRYGLITATFGRPPCKVVVEYGGDRSLKSKVAGTDYYCP